MKAMRGQSIQTVLAYICVISIISPAPMEMELLFRASREKM